MFRLESDKATGAMILLTVTSESGLSGNKSKPLIPINNNPKTFCFQFIAQFNTVRCTNAEEIFTTVVVLFAVFYYSIKIPLKAVIQ